MYELAGCKCDSINYMVVANIKRSLAVSKQATQNFDVERNNSKLNELDVTK